MIIVTPPQPIPSVELNLEDNYFSSTAIPVLGGTWHHWVQTWLLTLVDALPLADSYELSLRLTDDREIQAFNAQYRHKNQPTDVLAFAALEVDFPKPSDPLEPLYLGDIIISVETAIRQAQQHEHPLIQELAWLAAHGFLHLLGWDHPDEQSLEKMLSLQGKLLETVGLPVESNF